jgi:DNA (cytosine-5)-methyltransferase 1
VDNPVKLLSLCTGYGGVELGLQRLGLDLRTVAHVEIEAFACANLVAKMEAGALDAAPIHTDVKTFPYSDFRGCVDLLTAGYPCQPFSAAGARRGEDDPRHLWPHIAKGIQLCRPGWVFLENVEGHISLGLSTVISDLEEMGYRTTWGIFSAAEVGAPHQRKRVFILANSNGQGLEGSLPTNVYHSEGRQEQGIRRTPECGAGAMADTQRSGRVEDWEQTQLRAEGSVESPINRWPSRPGEAQQEWEEPRTVGDTEHAKRWQINQARRPVQRKDRLPQRQESSGGLECPSSELANTTHQLRQRGGPSAQKTGGSKYTDGCSRQTQPELGGAVDGLDRGVDPIANRVDRLKMIGNGVCPQTAAKAFATLHAELTQ